MNILGLSAYYHDSAAALLRDGVIVAAAQEERFSRKKHDARFPEGAIRSCLSQAGLSLADIDEVVFYDKPLVKFERLLETYLTLCAARVSLLCCRHAGVAERKTLSQGDPEEAAGGTSAT